MDDVDSNVVTDKRNYIEHNKSGVEKLTVHDVTFYCWMMNEIKLGTFHTTHYVKHYDNILKSDSIVPYGNTISGFYWSEDGYFRFVMSDISE